MISNLLQSAFVAVAVAGGAYYASPPGANLNPTGMVQEWDIPGQGRPLDLAASPDGSIIIATQPGNRVLRFDPRSRSFREFALPPAARAAALASDRDGVIWFSGGGSIGTLDPLSGAGREQRLPEISADPSGAVIDGQGVLWLSLAGTNRVVSFDTRFQKSREIPTPSAPEGLTIDRMGNLWYGRPMDDRLGKLEAISGASSDIALSPGSRPRRVAAGPDGSLWVTLSGSGRVARVDPLSQRVIREYPLPAGAAGAPEAVTVDGAGMVWISQSGNGSVVRLDPSTGMPRVFLTQGGPGSATRLLVDRSGKLWYISPRTNRLGVIE